MGEQELCEICGYQADHLHFQPLESREVTLVDKAELDAALARAAAAERRVVELVDAIEGRRCGVCEAILAGGERHREHCVLFDAATPVTEGTA